MVNALVVDELVAERGCDGPQLLLGEWEHVVVHVKWSPKKDEGFVEAFVNGVQTVPRTFRQTMYSSDRRNFLKIGCYRRRTNTATAVVMHDNLRVSGPPEVSHR